MPKSASVLWAVADAGTQAIIADAHHAAVRDVVDFMERELAATRMGAGMPDGAVAQAPCLARTSSAPHIALTFDDGTDPSSTPAFLDLLGRADRRATFFVLGAQAKVAPSLIERTSKEGHEMAIHGWTHRCTAAIPPTRLRRQLLDAKHVVEDITGTAVTWYRPPFAILSTNVLLEPRTIGLTPVLWAAWGRDWERSATPPPAPEQWSAWRSVVAFGLVSLSADMVYEGMRAVAGPFLSSLGASALTVGLITGAGEAMALVLRLFTGLWADHGHTHWRLTVVGYAMTAIRVPLLAITPLLGAAGVARSPCSAAMTETIPLDLTAG